MLQQVKVFDDVFAVGCQLGKAPIPTVGIISQVWQDEKWLIYINTAAISPGSSGGGLFKKYDEHYYLIGIPFCVGQSYNGQIMPHIAHAISFAVARDFVDINLVSKLDE